MADTGHAQALVDWETCLVADCRGERLPGGSFCWAHAEGEDLDAALRSLSDSGMLHARGVAFTADRLQRVLDAAPSSEEVEDDQRRPLRAANLDEARFECATFEDARLTAVTFGVPPAPVDKEVGRSEDLRVSFRGATFLGSTTFSRVAFHAGATFDGAHFEGDLAVTAEIGQQIAGDAASSGTTSLVLAAPGYSDGNVRS